MDGRIGKCKFASRILPSMSLLLIIWFTGGNKKDCEDVIRDMLVVVKADMLCLYLKLHFV